MQESDNMEDHLNKLSVLFQQLDDLGDESTEQWKIGMVFASLPSSYSTLVTEIEARPESDLKWSTITQNCWTNTKDKKAWKNMNLVKRKI